jgi:hypothetical protein
MLAKLQGGSHAVMNNYGLHSTQNPLENLSEKHWHRLGYSTSGSEQNENLSEV